MMMKKTNLSRIVLTIAALALAFGPSVTRAAAAETGSCKRDGHRCRKKGYQSRPSSTKMMSSFS